MPHLTLLYPFRRREEFDRVAPRFERECADVEPFSVTLSEVRFFRQRRGKHTLWLACEPQEALVELQARLQSVVPDCNDQGRHSDGFTPHLSVGQAWGKEAVSALLRSLRSGWQPLTFMTSEISLIWRGEPPDDVFRVDRTVGLGKP
jgi:2'-5' RNA ligase